MINSIISFVLGMIFISLIYPGKKRTWKKVQKILDLLKSNPISFSLIIISFLLGFLCAGIIFYWKIVTEKFFDVRFIEVFQVVAAFIIAGFITYFIQSKLSHNIKRREVISDLFSMFEKETTDLCQLGCTNINQRDEKNQLQIVNNFKKLSILLKVIQDARKPKGTIVIKTDILLKAFWAFKEAVTDRPFSKTPALSEADMITQIHDRHRDLITKVYKCKLDIYNI